MAMFAGQSNLAVWYANADIDRAWQQFAPHLGPRQRVGLAKGAAKARTRDSMQALDKLTTIVDGRPRIVADPPLVVPLSSLLPQDADASGIEAQLIQLVDRYRRTLQGDRRYLLDQYRFEQSDVARKVVGVGSVGTRCWIMLMLGKDAGDPLILQVKEAGPAVLSEFVGLSRYDNQGQRVVEGQRLMQAASDIFLGWLHVEAGLDEQPRDFYGRQLKDWKGSAEIEQMVPEGMATYGKVCGWTLARAHARSGDRIAIASYLGNSDRFDRAILEFSKAYADQNERDYNALAEAVKSGRIMAQSGL